MLRIKLLVIVAGTVGLSFALAIASYRMRYQRRPGSPVGPSPLIQQVEFDFASHQKRAPGSDNWPITWADDDHQYAAWGDGGGFGGTNETGRVKLGVSRIEGAKENFTTANVWGGVDAENPAQFEGKSRGILSIDDVLYMWVTPLSAAAGYREARMCVSHDHAATWERADWAFDQSDGFVMPTFLQFGKAYEGARDQFVYTYSVRLQDSDRLKIQKPGMIDLTRVPRDQLMERQAYEFFAGLSADGKPKWSEQLDQRHPVFEDPNGVGWTVSASYNAGLDRYLMMTEHHRSFKGNLGLFDAQHPWGPWTTILYEYNWQNLGPVFFWNFSNKWLSQNGRDFVLIFTGTGKNDAWNSVNGRFMIRQPR